MTHRAPEETAEVVRIPWRKRIFQEKNAPHLGFAVTTLLYIGFYIVSGVTSGDFSGAAVPQTISLAWTAVNGTWFGFLVRQRAGFDKEEK